jgi:predicted TIM-barrel fold metal-dependent hydrolase
MFLVSHRRKFCRRGARFRYPRRFAAFATLPVADPQAAASELEWAVGAGFKGALINGVTQGRFLDDPFFTPLVERVEALGVPICIHPAPPPEPVREAYFSGLEPGLVTDLRLWTHGAPQCAPGGRYVWGSTASGHI